MKSKLSVVVGLFIVLGIFILANPKIAQAASSLYDTLIKGEVKIDAGGVLDTGSGTFKINGTAMTATAAQLIAAGSKSSTGVTGVVAQVGGTVTATGTVTIVATWQALTNVYADVTNVFYAPTAVPTATTAINVLNGAGFATNVNVQR